MEINSIFFINVVFEAFSFLIMALFLKLFFEYKPVYKNVTTIILGIIYGTISISADKIFNLIMTTGALAVVIGFLRVFSLLVLEALFLYIIFRINFIRLCVLNIFVVIVSGIGNSASFLFFKAFGFSTDIAYLTGNFYTVIIGQVITNLFSILILSAIYFFKAYRFINVRSRFTILTMSGTFTVFAINMVIYFILLRQYSLSIWYLVTISFFLTAYGLLILFFLRKFRYYEDREIELKQQEFYNNSLKNTIDGFRRYKHNYNNNLMVITSMLKMEKMQELKDYVNDLLSFNNKLNMESALLNINNAALHGLIMSKLICAEKVNVIVKVNVIGTVSNIHSIKMLELCEILGILLDNAIEAVTLKDKNEVEFVVRNDDEILKFQISNYFDQSMEVYNLMLNNSFTSKGDGHGNGLKIIKDMVKANRYVLFNTYLLKEESIISQELIVNNN